jgi:hypothetical protein
MLTFLKIDESLSKELLIINLTNLHKFLLIM